MDTSAERLVVLHRLTERDFGLTLRRFRFEDEDGKVTGADEMSGRADDEEDVADVVSRTDEDDEVEDVDCGVGEVVEALADGVVDIAAVGIGFVLCHINK